MSHTTLERSSAEDNEDNIVESTYFKLNEVFAKTRLGSSTEQREVHKHHRSMQKTHTPAMMRYHVTLAIAFKDSRHLIYCDGLQFVLPRNWLNAFKIIGSEIYFQGPNRYCGHLAMFFWLIAFFHRKVPEGSAEPIYYASELYQAVLVLHGMYRDAWDELVLTKRIYDHTDEAKRDPIAYRATSYKLTSILYRIRQVIYQHDQSVKSIGSSDSFSPERIRANLEKPFLKAARFGFLSDSQSCTRHKDKLLEANGGDLAPIEAIAKEVDELGISDILKPPTPSRSSSVTLEDAPFSDVIASAGPASSLCLKPAISKPHHDKASGESEEEKPKTVSFG